MSRPTAVLISDVHFTIHTLEEASAAFLKAQFKAKILGVPLIVAGDLLDAKAIMRAECVNKIIELVSVKGAPEMIFLVGNHDKINEKSEDHSLNFLKPYAMVVNKPRDVIFGEGTEWSDFKAITFIPYCSDSSAVKKYIDTIPKGSLLIMHQGVLGSKAGHYIQDKSACPKEWFADYRVISGHYHERQDIECGDLRDGSVGLWSYLGNPYSLNFSEANTEKGYSILKDDGTLEFVPLGLRKHVKVNVTFDNDTPNIAITMKHAGIIEGDIVLVEVSGTREQLSHKIVSKKSLEVFLKCNNVRLNMVPLDIKPGIDIKSTSAQPEILDEIIGSLSNVSDEQKMRLKTLWKDLVNDEDTIVSSP